MSRLGGHRTECMGTAGCERINTAHDHVGKKGPGIHVIPDIQGIRQGKQLP